MYELTQVEKCRKLPPLWKQFQNLRKENLSNQIKKFLKIADKSIVPAKISVQDDG